MSQEPFPCDWTDWYLNREYLSFRGGPLSLRNKVVYFQPIAVMVRSDLRGAALSYQVNSCLPDFTCRNTLRRPTMG